MQSANFATFNATTAADEIRVASLRGRDHLVAPVVMVREGVLKNAFVDGEEIAASLGTWNGRPTTAPPAEDASGHPVDDGEFVSANTKDRLDSMGAGTVLGVEYDEDERALKGEIYYDVQRAADIGDTALGVAEAIANGDPVDVSVGYWHHVNETPGEFDGQSYEVEHVDLAGDHLAVLPNEDGACSWEDGCGTPRSTASATDIVEAARADGGTDAGSVGDRVRGIIGDADEADGRTTMYQGWQEDDPEDAPAPDVGDAVRWQSDAAGSIDGWRYGVVVDGLQDGPENQVLVAVYEPTDDGWENRNEQNPVAEDSLVPIGSDGVGSLPPISQLGGQSDAPPTSNTDDTHTTMSDIDIDALAERSAFTVEQLEEMGDNCVASLKESLDADADADDAGDDDTDDTSTDDTPAANTDDTADENYITEAELEARLQAAREEEKRENLIDRITTHSDTHDPEDLADPDDFPVAALESLAETVEEVAAEQQSAASAGYAGQAADRVNYTGAMGAQTDPDGDDDLADEYMGRQGALQSLANGSGEGGDDA